MSLAELSQKWSHVAGGRDALRDNMDNRGPVPPAEGAPASGQQRRPTTDLETVASWRLVREYQQVTA